LVEEPALAYGISPVEEERHRIQLMIDKAKTPEERNQLGQFSTPFPLARQMVAHAAPFLPPGETIRFVEPAVGTGVFLSAIASSTALMRRIGSVTGVEIDPLYAKSARNIWKAGGTSIIVEDFAKFAMDAGRRDTADFVCTNPPYVRHHHIPGSLKELMRTEILAGLSLKVSGLAGLYVYFILLSHNILAENAIASWLIPSEFMVTNYGAALREYFKTHVELIAMHQFDSEDVQFDDALVSSCVVLYKKKRPSGEGVFTFSHGGDLLAPRSHRKIHVRGMELRSCWRFNQPAEASDHTHASFRMGDLFDVRRGIATGANDFFLLTIEQAAALKIPSGLLVPVLPGVRWLDGSTIQADINGFPVCDKSRLLLNCQEPEEVARLRYPAAWRYFEEGRARGVHNGYLCASRNPWYLQEQRPPAPFLASYMGRSSVRSESPIRFFRNESRAIVTNNMLNLYPKPWLTQRLDESPQRRVELLRILNAIQLAVVLGGGRSYGGGLHKMEPAELSRLPLPALPHWATPDQFGQMTLL
jgi:hypothetical protein